MYVHVGNNSAIEGFRDPSSDDPDKVRYRPLDGDRVTEIVFPEGLSLNEAFSTTLAVMEHHMTQDSSPVWIESDSPGLTALLQEHWGISSAKTSRPKTWGKDTGAPDFMAASSRTAEEGK
jgi:hypothetical protein